MFRFLLPLALGVANVWAQTTTSCNPLNSTCPEDPALGTVFYETYNNTFEEFSPTFWNVTAGTDLISFTDNKGAQLPITKEGDSVTVVSNFYIFWGQVEIIMQAAAGTGIISTVILLSDDLDEIDYEIMGGNTTHVENNYYGWGNLSQYNALYYGVDAPQESFHNYTINWTQERIQWMINGDVVREQSYAEPGQYPQSPCRVQFGIWAGGASSEPQGTIDWAGGATDFSKAPFSMYVQSIKITDGTTNSSSYSYGDQTGLYSSIKVENGESKAYKALNKLSTVESAQQRWNGLSTGAKTGIACGVVGFFLIAILAFAFYCMRQRKQGRAEAAAHDREWDAQNSELMEYRSMMAEGNFAVSRQSVMMGVKADRPSNRSSKF